MQSSVYHIPALLDACIGGLALRPDGTYVDVTFGGGGHSRAILDRLGEGGHLYAFDQDALPGNDIVIYDIPLFHFVRVGKVPDPESDDLTKRTEPA